MTETGAQVLVPYYKGPTIRMLWREQIKQKNALKMHLIIKIFFFHMLEKAHQFNAMQATEPGSLTEL